MKPSELQNYSVCPCVRVCACVRLRLQNPACGRKQISKNSNKNRTNDNADGGTDNKIIILKGKERCALLESCCTQKRLYFCLCVIHSFWDL